MVVSRARELGLLFRSERRSGAARYGEPPSSSSPLSTQHRHHRHHHHHHPKPCMNEPPKPKCQMGDGDLKSQIFRDTFPRQLAPEIVMCSVASFSESRDDLALHKCTPSTLLYPYLCWNDAETGYHCTPGSRL